MTLEEEVAARLRSLRIELVMYQHNNAISHYNIMDGVVCLGGSIDTLEAAQIRLSDQQARAAIAVIQARCEAAGAEKERAAVVAWLRRPPLDEPALAQAIEAGEHRKDAA